MKTPYIGFGNDTLAKCQELRKGDTVTCANCGQLHEVENSKDDKGQETDLLMFYKCGDQTYLAGVNGRLVVGVATDCSGEI